MLAGCKKDDSTELQFDNLEEEVKYYVEKYVRMGAAIGTTPQLPLNILPLIVLVYPKNLMIQTSHYHPAMIHMIHTQPIMLNMYTIT